MKICSYTIEEYIKRVEALHKHSAPGVVLGGFMVDLAYQHLPTEGLFDAISETYRCLPDSIQILTPCTIGNGWLRIIDLGRFALTLYDKYQGDGVRVYVDTVKLDKWPEIRSWALKLKEKKEQDSKLLFQEILNAETSVLSYRMVKVDIAQLRDPASQVYICPVCGEAYRSSEGNICPGCSGGARYYKASHDPEMEAGKSTSGKLHSSDRGEKGEERK